MNFTVDEIDEVEELRKQRWHDTFNAAVSGLTAIQVPADAAAIVIAAAAIADSTHGVL